MAKTAQESDRLKGVGVSITRIYAMPSWLTDFALPLRKTYPKLDTTSYLWTSRSVQTKRKLRFLSHDTYLVNASL